MDFGKRVAGLNANTGTGGVARIGRTAPNGIPNLTRFFRGDIDELCLYSRALTASEVQELVCGPVMSIRVSQVEVCWQSATNISYQLQYQSALTGGQWTNLGTPFPGDGSRKCITDAIAESEPQRSYRTVTAP